jgi:hypothetical protein
MASEVRILDPPHGVLAPWFKGTCAGEVVTAAFETEVG